MPNINIQSSTQESGPQKYLNQLSHAIMWEHSEINEKNNFNLFQQQKPESLKRRKCTSRTDPLILTHYKKY